MQPAAIIQVENWPLTTAGKIDRQALPVPVVARRGQADAPRTPVEEILCSLFADVLDVERVGIADDFFALGGHSLLGTVLVSRVRDALGVDLPIRTLFEAPTVALLSARLPATGAARPALVRQPRPALVPASFAQQRLWFIDQLEERSAEYNMPEALRLRGRLDAEALRRAIETIVARHEILRTRFAVADGVPVQLIEPPPHVALPVLELQGLEPAARDAAVQAALRDEWSIPFDLTRGPLLRTGLLRLDEEEHVLLLTLHHIISDGWSQDILHRELATLYAAFIEGRQDPLPPLAIQYADFTLWQQVCVNGASQEGLAYWTAQLAGAPERLTLPMDRPRPERRTFAAERFDVWLTEAETAALRELGRAHQATLYMVLLAAFGTLLARHSGQDDVVVGTPIANRGDTQLEHLVGFFVNSLVMRVRVAPEQRFTDLLAEVRRTALDAYRHQDVPFERVVEAVAPPRSLNVPPVIQVTFALQSTPNDARFVLPGLRMEPVSSGTLRVRFDLEVHAEEEEDGQLRVMWLYNRDLFDSWRIEQMARHFARVLRAVAASPACRLDELPWLDAAERRQVLAEWNAPAVVAPRQTVPERFEAQAARTPTAIAIVEGETTITYAELDARANRLARRLVADGVVSEDVLAVSIPPSIDLIVALLGTLKAGAAYLPLDAGHPETLQQRMCQAAGVRGILTARAFGWLLTPDAPRTYDVTVMTTPGAGIAETETVWRRRIDPRGAAYVMFTSGSTGAAKGVVVAHAGIVRLVCDANYVTLDASTVLLQLAPVAFDASTFEIWGPLLNGGRLIVGPEDVRDLALVGEALRRHGVTTLWLTAGLFQVMVRERLDDLRGLRELIAGGDVLPVAEVRRAIEALTHCRLLNGYGPTEATTFTTVWPIQGVEPAMVSIPIGRAIGESHVYVLDTRLAPVPVGVAGELYIAGPGLARGYVGQAQATAASFVANPYGTAGTRMYRSGDLVRWRPDGTLEFLGRIDRQRKVRGFRVEPAEVEQLLALHAAVRDCLVLVEGDDIQDKQLIAYWIAAEGATATWRDLRQHMRERAPSPLVPAHFVRLEAWPLTDRGKIDRRALPPPAPVDESASEGEAVPSATEMHDPQMELLCSLFASVLGVERVSVDDDFFACGGHSLLATVLVSRIRATLGVELTIRTLFEAPTVRELSLRVRGARAARPPLTRQTRPAALPLSYAQQRLWVIDRLQGSSPEYNLPEALRLRGTLHVSALTDAINTIVARHEVLQTCFEMNGDQPTQRIDEDLRLAIPVEDLRALDAAAQHAAVLETLHDEWTRGFDLSRGPLLRLRLLRLAEAEHVLLVTLHHIVSDGWSQGVFNRELAALYGAYRDSNANPLPPLPLQYADFALWQRRWLEDGLDGTMQDGLTYWMRQLAGIPEQLTLPTDRPRPPLQTFAGARLEFTLTPAETLALKKVSHTSHATLYMTLLAAFGVVLARHSGQDDLVVGSPIANRQDTALDDLIGFFVNSIVIRLRIQPAHRFIDLLDDVRRTALEAYRYQDVPFERVVEALAPARTLSAPPIVQVNLALQNAPDMGTPRLPGLDVTTIPPHDWRVRFDLELHLFEHQGRLGCTWLYNRDLFDAWRMEQMTRQFVAVLRAITTDPAIRVGGLAQLDGAERRQILEQWNDTARPIPAASIVERFDAQAANRPRAIALDTGAQTLTYAALRSRANALAARLRSLGVGPETIVALALPSSIELVTAMLATLRAGGAYLPLDLTQPAARLATILHDAAPAVVLATRATASQLPDWNGPIGIVGEMMPTGDGAQAATDAAPVGDTPVDNAPPPPAAHPLSPAYVIYTSGSTGEPKGVVATHEAVLRLVCDAGYVSLDADTVVLQLAPAAFDASTFEIWGALLNGGRLILAPLAPGDLLDLSHIGDLLRTHGVTTLWLTSGLFHAMVRDHLVDLAGVRQLLAGGDVIGIAEARTVLAELPDCRLINGYGPTEATTFSCCHHVNALAEDAVSVPIGRPIGNTRVYVLDEYLAPALVGVPGELYVAGRGLARGYLKGARLTGERFVADPFGPPGARMYRTGDMVRWRPDGTLEFLGRVDRQVKIRGFRVELPEIEMLLSRHPAVSDCVVMMRGRDGHQQLLAYWIPASGAECGASELRRYMAERVPGYMTPADFVRVNAWPLTKNGKIDLRALPDPDTAAAGARESEDSGDDIQRAITHVWREALQREDVNPLDNYFDLGAHSLTIIQVHGALERCLGRPVRILDLFRYPTIDSLAQHLRDEAREQMATAGGARTPEGNAAPTRPPRRRVRPGVRRSAS
jgi:amino acid adenylation domain-containing protein